MGLPGLRGQSLPSDPTVFVEPALLSGNTGCFSIPWCKWTQLHGLIQMRKSSGERPWRLSRSHCCISHSQQPQRGDEHQAGLGAGFVLLITPQRNPRTLLGWLISSAGDCMAIPLDTSILHPSSSPLQDTSFLDSFHQNHRTRACG